MIAEAGVSIAYHAKPAVREKATYCFDYAALDGLLNLFTSPIGGGYLPLAVSGL